MPLELSEVIFKWTMKIKEKSCWNSSMFSWVLMQITHLDNPVTRIPGIVLMWLGLSVRLRSRKKFPPSLATSVVREILMSRRYSSEKITESSGAPAMLPWIWQPNCSSILPCFGNGEQSFADTVPSASLNCRWVKVIGSTLCVRALPFARVDYKSTWQWMKSSDPVLDLLSVQKWMTGYPGRSWW